MRALKKQEIGQRGCSYCTECRMFRYHGDPHRFCPYDECPFHELDKYKSYRHYLSESPDIFNVLVKPRHSGKRKKQNL